MRAAAAEERAEHASLATEAAAAVAAAAERALLARAAAAEQQLTAVEEALAAATSQARAAAEEAARAKAQAEAAEAVTAATTATAAAAARAMQAKLRVAESLLDDARKQMPDTRVAEEWRVRQPQPRAPGSNFVTRPRPSPTDSLSNRHGAPAVEPRKVEVRVYHGDQPGEGGGVPDGYGI